MRHRRQQRSCAEMTVEYIVILSPEPATHRVNDPIAPSIARMLKEGAADHEVAFRRPRQTDRIVHARGKDDLKGRPIRLHAEDMGGPRRPAGLTRQVVALFRKRPFAPVDQSIGTRIGTMQIVGTPRERLPIEPDRPFLRGTVTIAVAELQNLRRHGNIDRTLMPEHALRKAKAVRKDHTAVENPIAISVLQPQQPMRSLRPLRFRRLIRPRNLRHIKPTPIIKTRLHRSIHKADRHRRTHCPSVRHRHLPRYRHDHRRRRHKTATNQ